MLKHLELFFTASKDHAIRSLRQDFAATLEKGENVVFTYGNTGKLTTENKKGALCLLGIEK